MGTWLSVKPTHTAVPAAGKKKKRGEARVSAGEGILQDAPEGLSETGTRAYEKGERALAENAGGRSPASCGLAWCGAAKTQTHLMGAFQLWGSMRTAFVPHSSAPRAPIPTAAKLVRATRSQLSFRHRRPQASPLRKFPPTSVTLM